MELGAKQQAGSNKSVPFVLEKKIKRYGRKASST